MRKTLVAMSVAGLLLLSACGGGSQATPQASSTTIPTATPFATVPTPTIVTSTATPAASTGTGEGTTYVVVAGDVLSRIAERFGVSADDIAALNDLNGSDIYIGQELRIPAAPTTSDGGTAQSAPTPSTAGLTTYTVTAGDSAFGIALKFDTTLEALERANDVEPGGLDDLQIGQVLKLPPPGER